jgi:hypothetical protein
VNNGNEKHQERPSSLLLRRISKENFSTFLGDTEYIRIDVLSDLECVRKHHIECAKSTGFDDCGCDYCEVLSPLLFPTELVVLINDE